MKQNVTKLEVFILGRQDMGRGRKERIEKGSREIERKETKGTELTI